MISFTTIQHYFGKGEKRMGVFSEQNFQRSDFIVSRREHLAILLKEILTNVTSRSDDVMLP
jgi:hypothetical protein